MLSHLKVSQRNIQIVSQDRFLKLQADQLFVAFSRQEFNFRKRKGSHAYTISTFGGNQTGIIT